jgi:cytochrome c556
MAENTPKSKEEMEKALEDLQLDPADLDAVAGGLDASCDTCYSKYTPDVKGELSES